jgi:hypothetical protein
VLTFTVVVFLLNPLFWSQPVGALREVWEARQSLLKRQVVEIQTFAPNQILRSPTQRTAVMISHLFIRELQFAEVNNYKEETSDSQTRYLQMPGHNLFRGYIAGGITLGLTLMGITLAARGIRSRPENQRRNLTLLLIGTILQTAALVWAIPLPFQRYYLPIIPFTSLWAAYGLISFVSVMKDTPMDRMFRAACEALTHTNNR